MPSKVAEAYVAINANLKELQKSLNEAKALSIKETTATAAGMKSVIATVSYGALSGGLKAVGVVGTTAFSAVKMAASAAQTTFNAAAQTASNLLGVIKLVAVALAGIAATADTTGVKLNAMLRSSGQTAGYTRAQLDEMAKSIADAAGASQRLLREAQAVLLSFGAIRGDTFKQALESLPDLAAALGVELPAAAQAFGQALQDPAKGLELLKQMGITVPPTMQAAFEAAAQGSMAGWQQAQGFILQAVKGATKGAGAEMKGSLAGITSGIKAAFVDMADAIGPTLVPAAQAVVGVIKKIGETVNANKPLFSALSQGIAQGFGLIVKVIDFIVGALGKIPPGVLTTIASLAGVAAVGAGLAAAFLKVAVFIKPIVVLALSLLNPFNILLATVVLLGAAVAYAFTTERWGGRVRAGLDAVLGVVQRLWGRLQELGQVILQRVKPAFDSFVEKAVSIFEKISAFIAENEATWNEWATLIAEIVGGVVSTVITFFEDFVTFVENGLSAMSDATGITWEGIKETVTSVLDFLSLVFTDFKASLEIAWTAVQLAAVVAWEFIADIATNQIAVITGLMYGLVAVCTASWDNIANNFERTMGKVKAGFAGVFAAGAAIKEGKNPATAYREAYDAEMEKLNASAKKNSSVGEAAATAYAEGYNKIKGMVDYGDTKKELKDKLDNQIGELRGKRDKLRQEAEAAKQQSASGSGTGPGGAEAKVDMTANPGGMPNMIKVQFESVGFTEMWKKMQDRLTGQTTMQALTEMQAKNSDVIKKESVRQSGLLVDIKQLLSNSPPATAG